MPSVTTGATGLSGRYAAALYELAEADKKLDRVADDLRAMGRLIADNAELARVLTSPVLTRKEQTDAMVAVCDKAGTDDLTKRFVGTVAANRRLFALGGMIKAFLDELSHRRGETTAEVVSAKKLSEKQLSIISDVLKKAVGTKVAVEAKVDQSLLGGLVVQVGSRMVDQSLKTQLQQLRLSMKGVG